MEKAKIIIAITCFVVGIAVGVVLVRGTQKTDIKWKFGENELSINLDQDLVDFPSILSRMFSKNFSKQGTIDWLKLNQNLYQPTDPDLVAELSSLDYNELVSKELRELSIKRNGPWAYQLDTIKIGIPAEINQPKVKSANVCENGKYFTKRIKLFSLDQMRYIEVEATGKYECPKQLRYPDIQLNVEDAKKLLGTINFSKYEKGMALILN